MLKICLEKWDANKDSLKTAIAAATNLNFCGYIDLVRLVVIHILNNGSSEQQWNDEEITEINDGHYQGTLLYMIPRKTYQPSEYEYLLTYVGYGSCSGCDTLLAIQDYGESHLTPQQVDDFLSLCKDIVCNIIKPYNNGWREEKDYIPIET